MEERLSATALPWCWVIETLARSQQIGPAILSGLLLKAPPLYGKSGKEVGEAVAFRCLEEIAGTSSGSIDDHPTQNPSKARFNMSDSCEDVLQCILRENSGFDLQKDASVELKWNIRSFIELKKASLPRCSLELLKNLILEGTHPIVESLKEIKELELPCQRVLTITSGGVDPTSTSSTVLENGHSGQAMLAEENRDSSQNMICDQPEQSILPNGRSPQSKRGTSSDPVQEANDITHGMDDHAPPVKKRKLNKLDGLQSQKQPSVPCDGNGMSSATEDGQNHESPNASKEHDGKFNRENLGDPRKVHAHSDNQPRTSHDIHGDHPRETDDLAKKMLAFLSSGSTVPDDCPTMNETEVNLCMKCNNGGDLLICSSNTCPLAFHESCLDYSASFDDQGKFYCPFCAYSRAISEYVKAKEKVSLARRELSLFIGGRTSHRPQPDSARALVDDVNGQRQNEDISKTAEPKKGVNNVVTQVANCRQLRSSKNKQKEVSSSTASKAANASVAAPQNLTSEDRQAAETVAQLASDTTGTQNQGQGNHNTDDGNPLNQIEKFMYTRQKSSDLKKKKEGAGHQATEQHEDVNSETISDSDELSEDEKNKTTTSILSPRPLREVRAHNQSKRRKVLWTAEEEAILKKGVQKFGRGDNGAIPWKSILKFGGSVFQESRTPTDLKDKWRNMRGSPKVK